MVLVATLLAVMTLAGLLPIQRRMSPDVRAAPLPACVGTAGRSVWLGFGSYCWKTVCADMIPPGLRPHLPRLRVASDSWITVHV